MYFSHNQLEYLGDIISANGAVASKEIIFLESARILGLMCSCSLQ